MKRTTTLIAFAAFALPAAALAAGLYDDRMAGTPPWLQRPPASAPASGTAERSPASPEQRQGRFGSQSPAAAGATGDASAPSPLRQGRYGPSDEDRAGRAVREPERLR